jgi:hypothetical protein
VSSLPANNFHYFIEGRYTASDVSQFAVLGGNHAAQLERPLASQRHRFRVTRAARLETGAAFLFTARNDRATVRRRETVPHQTLRLDPCHHHASCESTAHNAMIGAPMASHRPQCRLISLTRDLWPRPGWTVPVTVACDLACTLSCTGRHCLHHPLDARAGLEARPSHRKRATNRLTNQTRLASGPSSGPRMATIRKHSNRSKP